MPSTKHVTVTVEAGGAVVCTPQTVNVSSANVLIVFHLETAGYAFPASDAVVVSNPGSQFPYPSWTAYPGYAALFDFDNDTAEYSYTVNVIELSTGRTLSVDPVIKNGGH
ncbi:MAG: hypothetical protein IV094_24945 [Vitreoscilla sp.]|nr:hypothetical protein [Vitreoscilla sp.]